MINADVDRIVYQRPDGSTAPQRSSPFRFDTPVIQVLSHTVCSVSFLHQQMEDFSDDFGFVFVDDHILHRLVPLVHAAFVNQPVAVWNQPTAIYALLNHLRMLGLHTNRSLLAFARRLPEADVVQQFVHMIVKPLLAFPGAPHFDSLLNKPLNHKRSLIVASADAVKHEYQQNIKLVQHGALFDFNDGVTSICTDLVAGDAFFGNLIDYLPVRMRRCVFAAGQLLHGNVVMIHLAKGRNTVEAYDTFHSLTSY